jgi:hypothetical protein
MKGMEEFEPIQPRDPNDPTLGAASVPRLPPSNLEIKIRTMATDIESVGKGGGLLGISEKISLSIPRENDATPEAARAVREAPPEKSKTLKYFLIGVFAAAALFAVGYFLPALLSKKEAGELAPPQAATSTPGEVKIPIEDSGKLTHKSFFAVEPDTVLSITSAVTSSFPLISQWRSALGSASGTITELRLNNEAGEYLGLSDFLSSLGVQFSAKDVLSADFERDFTAFAYRDASGVWPGLALKFKPEINILLARGDVAKFEAENGFIEFLLPESRGARGGGFKDAQLSGLPVRELAYSGKPAVFVYGITQAGYLLFASSEDAFKTALSRL